jgi:N-acetylmuramoyl-L-alanine amidase
MRKLLLTPVLALLLVTSALLPAQAETALEGVTICLDPGHGGSDPGAVYDDGVIYLEEKEINLDVAKALAAKLGGAGATVVLTRSDNEANPSNEERYTTANDAGADILVSIHTNSVLKDPEIRDGAMTLYFHMDDEVLARAIYIVMYDALRTRAESAGLTFTSFGVSKFASRILMSSNMPGTILEPVCMSNPTEAAWLTEPSGTAGSRRAEIVDAAYNGILAYFEAGGGGEEENPGGGPPCDSPPCKK